jgi:hypothetical protein
MPDSGLMWLPEQSTPDTHAAFRGRFTLARPATVELRVLAASWLNLWLDGAYLLDGPPRFIAAFPEYDVRTLDLSAGTHVLAAHVHHVGHETRILPDLPPFLFVDVRDRDQPVTITWKCTPLPGYARQRRRISVLFGWIDWLDTRQALENWQVPAFEDAAWTPTAPAATQLGSMRPVSIGPVQRLDHALTPLAQGPLAEDFGYEADDPPARFFLRDLVCRDLPPQGVWRRYDLGRVMLGRPSFTLDLPAGAVVEFGLAEALRHGRVAPWVTLTGGATCNFDHYIARGGIQEFTPLAPKGGRFLEVHILAEPAEVRFIAETFAERAYHAAPVGSFACPDAALNRIWQAGLDTYRACAEDAITDNPTRERGQWLGDALIGVHVASAGYADLRLARRSLMQSAQCARPDGLVAGLSVGGSAHVSSFAAQWHVAVLAYVRLSGDRSALLDFYEAALRNLAAFESYLGPDGLDTNFAWAFIDWGFDQGSLPANLPLNLHYLAALDAMIAWCGLVGRAEPVTHLTALRDRVVEIMRSLLTRFGPAAGGTWEDLGYHTAALGLAHGFFDDRAAECIAYLKRHMLDCFPNNLNAPRLSDPGRACRRLITPYFGHFAFPPLIERGEMDFVLEQYRRCWGWALSGGRTTCLEVFDTRWSHCHEWAACPTWQLSAYVLGLRRRFDLGPDHYVLNLIPGALPAAEGIMPSPWGTVNVCWKRTTASIHYEIHADREITLLSPTTSGLIPTPLARFNGTWRTTLP